MHQEVGREQAQQRPVGGIQHDRRMQIQAVLVAVVAQAGGVLHHQQLAPRHAGQQMRPRTGCHFLRAHPRVAQEALEPDLPGPVSAQPAQPDAARAA